MCFFVRQFFFGCCCYYGCFHRFRALILSVIFELFWHVRSCLQCFATIFLLLSSWLLCVCVCVWFCCGRIRYCCRCCCCRWFFSFPSSFDIIPLYRSHYMLLLFPTLWHPLISLHHILLVKFLTANLLCSLLLLLLLWYDIFLNSNATL